MSHRPPISDDELDALDESLGPGELSLEQRVLQLEAVLSTQEERLQGMLRIAANLGRSRDPNRAMRAMVAEISRLLQADRTTIYEVDRESSMLRGLAVEGESSLQVGVRLGSGIAGLVAERGRAINLKDAYLHPAFDPKFDKLTGYRTRSMLVVPMRNPKRDIIGVVQVLNKCTGYFTVEDQKLLNALASQAGMTLEALRLQLALNLSNTELSEAQEGLKQTVRELELLFNNEQAISGAETMEELADRVLKVSSEVARCEAAALYLADVETGAGEAWLRAAGDAPLQTLCRLEVGDGVLGKTASRGAPLLLEGQSFEAHAVPRELGGGCRVPVIDAVTAPLLSGGETVGAFALINRRDLARREPAKDQRLAVLIAGQLARAVSRLHAREESQRRDRMMTIGQMLSGVLHDLRGPMSIISGYTQLMAESEDPEDRAQMSAAIRRKIELFNDMTREVMAFARGERQVFARKVYLSRFVRAVRESVDEEYASRGVIFEVHDRTATGMSWFDETKMLRVITNIARNARQAMGTSGRFCWSIEDTPEGGTRFRMSDTGPGIPEAIREKLFEAFTTAGKDDGTGLGLAIVRRIVEDHRGTVSFTTKTDQGTEFVIELPPSPESAAPQPRGIT